MTLYEIMARQLANPHGLIGRLVTGRILAGGNESLNAWTIRQLPVAAGERVLDLGCGPGAGLREVAARFPRAQAVGTDYSAEMARQAAARARDLIAGGRALVTRGDGAALGFRDGAFDHVFAVNVVYFWPDAGAVLREIRRVLRPGGTLALGFRPRELVEQLRFPEFGYRAFDPDELRSLVAGEGFTDLRLLPEPDPPKMAGLCLAGVRG